MLSYIAMQSMQEGGSMKEFLILFVFFLLAIFLYFVIKKWDKFLQDNFDLSDGENEDEKEEGRP